jgi:alkylation response protein AidB-like acyl-CoA dehydrogenase
MDLTLSDDQQLLRRTVREFAEAEIRPHVMAWDEAQAASPRTQSRIRGKWRNGVSLSLAPA